MGLRWRFTVAATGLVLAGSGIVGLTAAAAPAPPAVLRVLQAVRVDLGTDASVQGLNVTTISAAAGGGSASTKSRAVDPSRWAGDLPVRIGVSWSHDGRVGTDLRQLEHASGRVRFDITVQNTTVRPTRLDAATGRARDYELVTTPVTVVASAVLPRGSFASVRRSRPGASEPGTTNGVVSERPGGAASVQWASLLAPPRLAASTTFTFVQDARDFRLPAVTVAVQPGLTSDPSVARLVDATFSGAQNLINSENNTIGLIGEINTELSSAASHLELIRQTLGDDAGQIGAAATSSLDDTAGTLDESTKVIANDLTSLQGAVTSGVENARDQSSTAIDESVSKVLAYFGDPGTTAGEPAPPLTCGSKPDQATREDTLLGQLKQVSRLLHQIRDAGTACAGDARAAIDAAIGNPKTCGAQPPGGVVDPRDQPLICRLHDTSDDLVAVAENLHTEGQGIVDLLDPEDVSRSEAKIHTLQADVAGLQRLASGLAPAGDTDLGHLLRGLATLDGQLADIERGLDSAGTAGLTAQLRSIATRARDRLDELGPGAGSVRAQLLTLADDICDGPAGTDEERAHQDRLHTLVTGDGCAGRPGEPTPGYATPLTERLDSEREAWRTVLDSTDVDAGSLHGAAAELAGLRTALGDVAGDIDTARATLDRARDRAGTATGANQESVAGVVLAVLHRLDALYDPDAPEATCENPGPDNSAPLNQLQRMFEPIVCSRDSVGEQLRAAVDRAAGTVGTSAVDSVRAAEAQADSARAKSAEQLDDLAGELRERLDETAAGQEKKGKEVATRQTGELNTARAVARTRLNRAAGGAIGLLAKDVDQATTQTAEAGEQLQNQLKKVMLDLGSADTASGLLGLVADGAGRTQVRIGQVERVADSANAFGNVRRADLADARLEQQQVSQSLRTVQALPAFAESVPAGAARSAVFVFRFAGDE